jgi:hypothetical protein
VCVWVWVCVCVCVWSCVCIEHTRVLCAERAAPATCATSPWRCDNTMLLIRWILRLFDWMSYCDNTMLLIRWISCLFDWMSYFLMSYSFVWHSGCCVAHQPTAVFFPDPCRKCLQHGVTFLFYFRITCYVVWCLSSLYCDLPLPERAVTHHFTVKLKFT